MKRPLFYPSILCTLLLTITISCSKDNDSPSDDDNGGGGPETSEILVRTQTEEPTLDFGRLYPNFNYSQKSFQITNIGTVPISVTGIEIPNSYALTEPFSSFSLGPVESRTFTIRFYPEEDGDFTGTVRVSSDAEQGIDSFQVIGKGSRTALDYDGNEYNIVRIGNQLWTLENYKGATASDGSSLEYVSYADQNLDRIYGKLYSRNTLMAWNSAGDRPYVKRIMPDFIIPTNTDWNNLFNFLGGTNVAGGKMKQAGTGLWQAPNTGATNSSGFTALPAGSYNNGTIYNTGTAARFWGYKDIDPAVYDYVYSCNLVNGSAEAIFQQTHSSGFFSVRLVQRKMTL